METDIDHVHVLLEYSPRVSVSDIIRQLKQYSTYQMWDYHTEYFPDSIGNTKFFGLTDILPVVLVKCLRRSLRYIQNQG